MAGKIIIYCHTYQPKDRKTEGKRQHILGREVLKQALINEYELEFTKEIIKYIKK